MNIKQKHLLMAAVACCGPVQLANHAWAQGGPAASGAKQQVDVEGTTEIIITGVNSRLSPSIDTFPGSVTVIGSEEVATQLAISTDVAAMLATKVPGFATQSFSSSDFGQTMRGRGLSYYVDGMPISNPLRDGGRSLRSVATSAIGGVEVIRGASALYGNGGNGGAVNYITKRARGEKGFSGRTMISVSGSFDNLADSLSPFIQQDIELSGGGFDLLLTGSAEFVGSFFDAQGDRIASDPTGNGGITDSDIYTMYAKGGYTNGDHRIEASYMLYEQTQNTAWGGLILGVPQQDIKTLPALGQVDPRVVDQYSRNRIGQISYIFSNFFGGTARAQAYHIKNSSLFGFNARRAGGTQSLIESRKTGARLDFNNPLDGLGIDGSLLWGTEYIRDKSVQTVNTDPARVFVPEIDQKNYAGYGQIEVRPVQPLTLNGGVRYDKFDVSVADFTVLDSSPAFNAQGGKLSFESVVVNAGASFQLDRALTVFTSYSEGFSLPDIGLAIRGTRVVNPLVALRPEPVVVKSYEMGVRGQLDFLNYSFAAFRSTSRLGQGFAPDPANPLLSVVVRAPERVWGLEGTVDGKLFDDRLSWGGTFTLVRGKRQQNIDSDPALEWVPLPNDRIPPVKVSGYLEYEITPDFPVRLQAVYSGRRDVFPRDQADALDTCCTTTGGTIPVAQRQIWEGSASNFARVKPFVTMDMLASHPIGGGKLSVAITNLLDKFYFPTANQFTRHISRAQRFVPAPGRAFRIAYTFEY